MTTRQTRLLVENGFQVLSRLRPLSPSRVWWLPLVRPTLQRDAKWISKSRLTSQGPHSNPLFTDS
jgi:hypothetical protein